MKEIYRKTSIVGFIGGTGLITFRYYSTQMVKNNKIRLLAVNGVEPTVDSIRSGEYPITNEFYAVTAGSNNPHVEAFIEWILSDEGQEIVEKTGYVPVGK